MRIGHGKAWLELHLEGYQFPDLERGLEPLDGYEWDSSWLIIAGEVGAPDGLSWSFQDAFLTTREVSDLIGWLRKVVDGVVAVVETSSPAEAYEPEGWLSFTEPNLSLAVSAYNGPQLELLVALSHECAPPPIDPRNPQRVAIALATDTGQLKNAAAAFEKQLVQLTR